MYGLRLVPKLVTLNDLERCNSHYLALFCRIYNNLVAFVASCDNVVDWASTYFSPEACHRVHQLSTTDALCSLR